MCNILFVTCSKGKKVTDLVWDFTFGWMFVSSPHPRLLCQCSEHMAVSMELNCSLEVDIDVDIDIGACVCVCVCGCVCGVCVCVCEILQAVLFREEVALILDSWHPG